MKALVREVYGPPEVLELRDVEKPAPAEGEVLVRIRATALNASDLEILTGQPLYGRVWGFFTPKYRILGSDVAGTVEAVGPGVTRFEPGDAVYGDLFERWGGLAEWTCAPEGLLRPKPEDLSFVQAAALPQSGALALQGLSEVGHLKPGERVLINGAGGGVGTFAIQLAKHLGAEVSAVDSAEKLDLMRALGADQVIDYAAVDVTAGGQRFDLILDLVGHHSLSDFRRALAPRGRYYLVGGPMKLVLSVLFCGTLRSLFARQKTRLLTIRVNEGLEVLEAHARSGAVVPAIDRIYALSEAPEAFRRLAAGRARGKLVITPPEA